MDDGDKNPQKINELPISHLENLDHFKIDVTTHGPCPKCYICRCHRTYCDKY